MIAHLDCWMHIKYLMCKWESFLCKNDHANQFHVDVCLYFKNNILY